MANIHHSVDDLRLSVSVPRILSITDTNTGSKKGGGKAGQTDPRKKAQELAAHREKLLSGRHAGYVLNYLEKKTQFDRDQIRALQRMYRCFKGPYPMDRLRFREMVASCLGVTDNMMLDRIFQAFDCDNEGSVSEVEWIIGLSVQLRGTLEQQTAYTYDVYDINGDRSIGREEVTSFFRNSLYTIKGVLEPEELDDGINEIVELAMRKFDINRDGNISFSEFRHIVQKDPLLLEAFGDCLPRERAALPFVSLLDTDERSFNCFLSRPGDSSWNQERLRYSKFMENDQHFDYEHQADQNPNPTPDDAQSLSPSSWSKMGLLTKEADKKKQATKPKTTNAQSSKSKKAPQRKKT